MTFCSASCVHEWTIRTGGPEIRIMLLKRDKGVCACCGVDTLSLRQRIHPDWNLVFREWSDQRNINGSLTEAQRDDWREYRREVVVLRDTERAKVDPGYVEVLRSGRSDLWDADHIIPVEEGGGQCGLSNYQTLCVVCHLKKNAKHAAQRSQRTRRRTGRRNYRKR